jgi:hypothetical protein
MNLADQITAMEKRLDEAVDGVLAEQIGTNSRLDDMDFQLREMRDMLAAVLSLLQPEEP